MAHLGGDVDQLAQPASDGGKQLAVRRARQGRPQRVDCLLQGHTGRGGERGQGKGRDNLR